MAQTGSCKQSLFTCVDDRSILTNVRSDGYMRPYDTPRSGVGRAGQRPQRFCDSIDFGSTLLCRRVRQFSIPRCKCYDCFFGVSAIVYCLKTIEFICTFKYCLISLFLRIFWNNVRIDNMTYIFNLVEVV